MTIRTARIGTRVSKASVQAVGVDPWLADGDDVDALRMALPFAKLQKIISNVAVFCVPEICSPPTTITYDTYRIIEFRFGLKKKCYCNGLSL